MRILIVVALLFFALTDVGTVIFLRAQSLGEAESLCWLDFVQNYVMANAVFHGVNPYQSVEGLFAQYSNGMSCDIPVLLPQPSPHPPPSIFLFLPFVAVAASYNQAALMWSVFSLLFLLLSIWRFIGRPLISVILFVGVFGAHSLSQDVWLVNMHTFLLGISLELLGAYQRRRDRAMGAALGVLLSTKLIGIPLFIYFALQRQFRVIIWSVGILGMLYGAAIAIEGFSVVPDYQAAVQASYGIFGHQSTNLSLLLIGQRFFGALSAYPDAVDMFEVAALPPLIGFSLPLAWNDFIGIVVVIIVILICLKRQNSAQTVAALLAIVPATQPLSWYYTQSLLLPAIWYIAVAAQSSLKPLRERAVLWAVVCIGLMTFSRILQIGGIEQLSSYQAAIVLLLDSLIPLIVVAAL